MSDTRGGRAASHSSHRGATRRARYPMRVLLWLTALVLWARLTRGVSADRPLPDIVQRLLCASCADDFARPFYSGAFFVTLSRDAETKNPNGSERSQRLCFTR